MGRLTGWAYRKRLRVPYTKIDDNLTDFPVLVKLTSANFNFNKALSNGYDIRFTSDDGVTLLSYERERHDSANQKAEYHVKIPSVSITADTYFYMYYGNPSAGDGANPTDVWDSNFKGVWHLNRDPSGTAPQEKDSTSNGNDGASEGSMTSDDLVEGKVDGALDFDGSDDYIGVNDDPTLDFGMENFTIEALVKLDVEETNAAILSKTEAYDDDAVNYALDQDGSTGWRLTVSDGSGTSGHSTIVEDATDYSTGVWVYIVGEQLSDGTLKLFTNGELRTTGSVNYNTASNNGKLYIGSYYTKNFFDGIIDEVRISNIARSPAWIKASYNSGNATLVSYGNEEVLGNSVMFACNF